MDLAALPARPGEHPGDRGLQPGVGVGDHQAHPAEAPVLEAAEERGPEHLVFAVTDVDAEHLAVAVDRHRGGDDHRPRHDPVLVTSLDVGGVEVHVRHGDVIEAPGPERGDLLSIPAQIRDTVDFDTPDSQPSARTRSSTFRVDVPVDVGGHDHRPQGPIDPTARLEQLREERPDPQLRDPQLDVPRRRRQQPGPRPVALGRPSVGPFVGLGADRGGELGVDQVLHAPLEQPAEQILRVTVAQATKQVSNSGIIVTGHRVVLLSECFRGLTKSHAMAHPSGGPRYLHHVMGHKLSGVALGTPSRRFTRRLHDTRSSAPNVILFR